MALLEEAIRVLAVPTGLLIEALKADKPTSRALGQMAHSVWNSGESSCRRLRDMGGGDFAASLGGEG